MLFTYNLKDKLFNPLEESSFKSLDIFERRDLEKWVEEYPEIVGEQLLIISTEYDKFNKTNERLDVLALDRSGKIVVIELKRDDSGKNVELQALKYAAYCSTLTIDDVIKERALYLTKKGGDKSLEEIKDEIDDFVENQDFEQIDDKPRIILISKEFRAEVTTSVLWLRTFLVDISCIKLTPYIISKSVVGVSSNKIIPLPDAEDYQIQVERKESKTKNLTKTQKEYLQFWKKLKLKFEEEVDVDLTTPHPISYYQIPIGKGGVHFEWLFHKKKNKLGVELHFEKSNKDTNLKILNNLTPYLSELKKKINKDILTMPDWGKKWSRLTVLLDIGDDEDVLISDSVNIMKELYLFLKPKIDNLK